MEQHMDRHRHQTTKQQPIQKETPTLEPCKTQPPTSQTIRDPDRNNTRLHQAAVVAVGSSNSLPHGLAVLSSFPEAATDYGLTPATLAQSLRELWVAPPDVDLLATSIATRTQCAIVSEYHQRCRTIATERNARQLFNQHVLGIVP